MNVSKSGNSPWPWWTARHDGRVLRSPWKVMQVMQKLSGASSGRTWMMLMVPKLSGASSGRRTDADKMIDCTVEDWLRAGDNGRRYRGPDKFDVQMMPKLGGASSGRTWMMLMMPKLSGASSGRT